MKKIVKKIVRYQCSICEKNHKTEIKAKKCESLPIEKQKFKKGLAVQSVTTRICWIHLKAMPGTISGKIIRIIGPMPPRKTYKFSRLDDRKTIHSHTMQYEVEYRCPVCNNKERACYSALELKRKK